MLFKIKFFKTNIESAINTSLIKLKHFNMEVNVTMSREWISIIFGLFLTFKILNISVKFIALQV